jgi:hypothetical protein
MKMQLIIKRTANYWRGFRQGAASRREVRQVRQEREGVIIKCKLTENWYNY